MNKDEFLRRLESLLSDISSEERAEAMAFYYSYFEDAGEGNEATILAELESPEKVAETIKKDLGMVAVVSGSRQNTENEEKTGAAGYTAGSDNANEAGNWTQTNVNQNYGTYNNRNQNIQAEKKDNTLIIVLIIIIAVITSPVWLGILGGLIGTVFGLLVSIVAITVALLAAAVGLFVAGIGCLTVGMAATGFALMGASLLVLALGILSLVACVWIYGGFLPWLCKAVVGLFKKNTDAGKEQRAV